jgi:hypothetical protein
VIVAAHEQREGFGVAGNVEAPEEVWAVTRVVLASFLGSEQVRMSLPARPAGVPARAKMVCEFAARESWTEDSDSHMLIVILVIQRGGERPVIFSM